MCRPHCAWPKSPLLLCSHPPLPCPHMASRLTFVVPGHTWLHLYHTWSHLCRTFPPAAVHTSSLDNLVGGEGHGGLGMPSPPRRDTREKELREAYGHLALGAGDGGECVCVGGGGKPGSRLGVSSPPPHYHQALGAGEGVMGGECVCVGGVNLDPARGSPAPPPLPPGTRLFAPIITRLPPGCPHHHPCGCATLPPLPLSCGTHPYGCATLPPLTLTCGTHPCGCATRPCLPL